MSLTNNWFDEDELYKCVHCGFCLQSCPTYLETGLETESPRGRIALMKAVNESRIEIDKTVIGHWDLCIQCRACEVACPSGVPYGSLIEKTLENVEPYRVRSTSSKFVRWLALRVIIKRKSFLSFMFSGLKLYSISGIQKMVRKTGLLRFVSKKLDLIERASPTLHGPPFKAEGQSYESKGPESSSASLLSGCVMPLSQGDQMRAVINVLTENGTKVKVPNGQVCCGAISSHLGDMESSRQFARDNIDAFSADQEPIIVASAGCGARMKEYGPLLDSDPEYAEKAREFSKRVLDIHEYISEKKFDLPTDTAPCVVTYQDSCHLGNVQGIREYPRRIIRGLPGVDLKELKDSNICCGAGGAYMVTQPEMSNNVLSTKLKNIQDTGADVVVTANPGCYMQLENGVRESKLDIKVKYVVEMINEYYEKTGKLK